MEEMPFQNMPFQRLRVPILPLGLTCSGLVTISGEILTIGTEVRREINFKRQMSENRN
jgi:hypothetical protein